MASEDLSLLDSDDVDVLFANAQQLCPHMSVFLLTSQVFYSVTTRISCIICVTMRSLQLSGTMYHEWMCRGHRSALAVPSPLGPTLRDTIDTKSCVQFAFCPSKCVNV